jgi:hypothetical protein
MNLGHRKLADVLVGDRSEGGLHPVS